MTAADESEAMNKHDDTSRLERICGIILKLVAEIHDPNAAISMSTLNGLKRVALAALNASRAERRAPSEPAHDSRRTLCNGMQRIEVWYGDGGPQSYSEVQDCPGCADCTPAPPPPSNQ